MDYLAVDTEAKPTIGGKSIMTTALTCLPIIGHVGAKNQPLGRLIGGGSGR